MLKYEQAVHLVASKRLNGTHGEPEARVLYKYSHDMLTALYGTDEDKVIADCIQHYCNLYAEKMQKERQGELDLLVDEIIGDPQKEVWSNFGKIMREAGL